MIAKSHESLCDWATADSESVTCFAIDSLCDWSTADSESVACFAVDSSCDRSTADSESVTCFAVDSSCDWSSADSQSASSDHQFSAQEAELPLLSNLSTQVITVREAQSQLGSKRFAVFIHVS